MVKKIHIDTNPCPAQEQSSSLGMDGTPEGAPPSNTAPTNYIDSELGLTVLRNGVDSLYLSYRGRLTESTAARLGELKLTAQSSEPAEAATAQWKIGEHLFEVKDRGRGRFAYVLRDNCFDISIPSASSRSLPIAYVQISSVLLTAVGFQVAEKRLRYILNTLALIENDAGISRIDLFVDFTSELSFDELPAKAWVTHAAQQNAHYYHGDFSGWSIGAGSQIVARLYDKTLEIKKSKKDYLKPIWEAAGWDGDVPVWRLEFQLKREVLTELCVKSMVDLPPNLSGLWRYVTKKWLRLTLPVGKDINRTRWPVHPVWEALSNINWGHPSAPTLARVRTQRIPSDETLFVNGLGAITSFMAREGIKDIEVGLGEYLARAHAYHDSGRNTGGPGYRRYVQNKVSEKGRKYNTINNENIDEAKRRRQKEATRYRKGKDGE